MRRKFGIVLDELCVRTNRCFTRGGNLCFSGSLLRVQLAATRLIVIAIARFVNRLIEAAYARVVNLLQLEMIFREAQKDVGTLRVGRGRASCEASGGSISRRRRSSARS